MTKVVLLSGLPGCGKSHWAASQRQRLGADRVVVVSTDNEHMVDGIYIYRPARVAEAHRLCKEKYLTQLVHFRPEVLIVDNTNSSVEELTFYYDLAVVLKLPVVILRWYCEPLVSHTTNQHQVPLKTILLMHQRINQPLPSYWNVFVTPSHGYGGGNRYRTMDLEELFPGS